LPPAVVIKKTFCKIKNKGIDIIGKLTANVFGTEMTDADFLRKAWNSKYKFENSQELRKHFHNRRKPEFFINSSKREEITSVIREHFPDALSKVTAEADKLCKHIFNLLGSGDVNLGEKIDWHCDFKVGYRWNPKKYYKEIRPAYGKADIKVPWELSRFQHAAFLGQAYWLTGDDKYALEFVRQIDDWIDRNPPKFGVNWACTMDVAIRVANWILGFYFFKDSKALTDEFLIKFLKSLLIHGRHIMSNLENKGITTNHYLSDLVGLIYLGIAFPEFKEARQWREFGIKELVNEINKQVYDDGMDFEASTCYHRLALELFFYPALLCRLNGIDLPKSFINKLKKMFDFVLYVLKPNGRMPQIGDNDNGRLHVLGKREILDMTYLLTYAFLYFNDSIYKVDEFGFAPEALWLFGPNAYESWSKLPGRSVEKLESRAFPDGGIYVMRHKKDYMVISCGPNGQGGRGGHAHNDKLSFELWVDGEDIIVDPGTYVYTADPEWRNRFRSTEYHNTIMIDHEEQNTFKYGASSLFHLQDRSRARCIKWRETEESIIFVGEHFGYNKIKMPISHIREIRFYKNCRKWKCRDFIVGSGDYIIHWNLNLKKDKKGIRIKSLSNMKQMIGYYSPGYGYIQECQKRYFDVCKQGSAIISFCIEVFDKELGKDKNCMIVYH